MHIPPGVVCDSCKEAYPQDEYGLCPKCHPREKCANARCSRPAYFSAQFIQPFSYCSPDCRDNDMIGSGKAKQDIENSLSQLKDAFLQSVEAEDR